MEKRRADNFRTCALPWVRNQAGPPDVHLRAVLPGRAVIAATLGQTNRTVRATAASAAYLGSFAIFHNSFSAWSNRLWSKRALLLSSGSAG